MNQFANILGAKLSFLVWPATPRLYLKIIEHDGYNW